MQTVQYAAHEAEQHGSSEADSLFGICQAVGDDLGFNPFFLRIAFMGLLFISPALMLGAYVGLGVLVAASRLLFPKPRQSVPADAVAEQPVVEDEPELIAA